MSWTYLALCNRVLRRMNEVQLTSSTFTSTVGFQSSVQDAVNDALNDIYDAELNWPFLHSNTTVATTTYQPTYNLPATQTEIDWNSFFRKGNLTASPPQVPIKMGFLSYQEWQDKYKAMDEQIVDLFNLTGSSQGSPPERVIQINDHATFNVSPPPDVAYTIYYEYWYRPTDLVLFGDTIVIPDQFSKVVIDGATYYSYMFRDNVEEAQVMFKKFTDGINQMRTRLINKQDYMRSDQTQLGTSSMGTTPGYI